MAQKYGKLDYSRCRIGELRQFVLDREDGTSGSPVATRKLHKDDLIGRLRELDCDATFHRFAELPPEVRMLTYPYLLTYDTTRKAQTAILRVSKLLHQEAVGVLYEGTTFEICIEEHDAIVHVGGRSRGSFRQAMLLSRGSALKALAALMAMRAARHL